MPHNDPSFLTLVNIPGTVDATRTLNRTTTNIEIPIGIILVTCTEYHRITGKIFTTFVLKRLSRYVYFTKTHTSRNTGTFKCTGNFNISMDNPKTFQPAYNSFPTQIPICNDDGGKSVKGKSQ
jgi:hypothetical protein